MSGAILVGHQHYLSSMCQIVVYKSDQYFGHYFYPNITNKGKKAAQYLGRHILRQIRLICMTLV